MDGAMGTRTSRGEIIVWFSCWRVGRGRDEGVVARLEEGVDVVVCWFGWVVEEVEERGLEVVVEGEADAEVWAFSWVGELVLVLSSSPEMWTSVAVRAQHHASLRRIQWDRPSFHSISSSIALNRFLFFASRRSFNCVPTLSGSSNLYVLLLFFSFRVDEVFAPVAEASSISVSDSLEYCLSLQSTGSNSNPNASPLPSLLR